MRNERLDGFCDSMKVFILATARRPELLAYTTLVFNSIRVGFPSAKIFVQGNALPEFSLQPVKDGCQKASAHFENWTETIHHEWIEKLINQESEPFWIVDTDVIFHGSVEEWSFPGQPLAGRRIPEFFDDFSGCRTRSRLHTSLLYIWPADVREKLESFTSQIAKTPFTPMANPVYPVVVPFKGRGIFYDTCSMLYHAIGGQSFSDEQNDAFSHFHFGTISDIVIPRLRNVNGMEKVRSSGVENPELMRNSWRVQQQYFEARQ